MRAIYLLGLYSALFVTTAIGVRNYARSSRRSISRNERDASGQDVRITEVVTSERRGDDGAPIVEEEEVETSLSDNQKRFIHKRRKRGIPNNSDCRSVKPPESGHLTCTLISPPNPQHTMICRAVCIDNYKFPDGSVFKPYNCTRGGNGWKAVVVPNCQPAKEGIGCQGISIEEKQTKLCVTTSKTKKCKSQCNAGYRFPNGESEMEIKCTKSTGVYEPVDKFPDCVKTDIKDDTPPE